MKRNYFFPRWCKKAGLILTLVLGLILALQVWGHAWGVSWDPFHALAESTGINPDTLLGAAMALFAISLLMAGFSREKDEDEYVSHLRGTSLIYATVINYLIVAVVSLTVYGFEFLDFMVVALYMIMVLHILIFNIMLYKARKTGRYEE